MKKTLTLLTILLAFCMPVFADENDNVISLNGHDWELTFWEQPDKPIRTPKDMKGIDAQTIVASVPGNVELDLMNAGLYPKDIMKGNRAYEIFKWERYQWCYTKKFDMSELQEGQRAILYMGGVDCLADVWLNGEKVASLENMLIEHEMDITDLLKKKNTLQVIFRSVMAEAQNYRVGTLPYRMDASPATMNFLNIRKSTHAYGWSILPRILSAALYRDVEIRVKNPVNIVDVNWYTVWIDKANKTADLYADFQLKAPLAKFDDLTTVFTLFKDGKETVRQSAPLLSYAGRHHVRVPNAELWWPRGYGEPALYEAVMEVVDKDGTVLCTDKQNIGIRKVRLERNGIATPENPGKFQFYINDEPIFVRGTNWVPIDIFYSKEREMLPDILNMMTDLNCNMVRIWGGGLYEHDDFYNFCDANGIMIWQDFAFACTHYPQDDEFAKKVENEIRSVVIRLRNHPSLTLWCGNNEIDRSLLWQLSALGIDPGKDRISREVIPHVLYEFDPTRPYLPSSPYHSSAAVAMGQSDHILPECHLWSSAYYKDWSYTGVNSAFASEVGWHGCPDKSSLEKMFDEEYVYPWDENGNWNDEWITKSYRSTPKSMATNGRVELLRSQTRNVFGECPTELGDFINASQIAQAEAFKYCIEFWRGGKFNRTGVIWWNLRDGWPITSDAVVDWYNSPKLAYHYIKQSQFNVCAFVNDPVDGTYPLMVANDTREPQKGSISVTDVATGKILYSGEYEVSANSRVEVTGIPEQEGQGMLLIEYFAEGQNRKNHYLYGTIPFKYSDYLEWYEKAGIYDMEYLNQNK